MKKILVALVAALVSFSAYALIYTNQAGDVIQVTLLSEGVAPASQTTTPRLYTPIVVSSPALTLAGAQAYYGIPGQLLVNTGSTGTTQFVYVNLGTTNWVLVK